MELCGQTLHTRWWIIVVLVWPSDFTKVLFPRRSAGAESCFMQFSWNSGLEELIKGLFVREIDSDCCCSISKQLVSYPLPVGPTDSFVEFSKQKIFTYPFPSKFIGICRQTLICCQNSRLYNVITEISNHSKVRVKCYTVFLNGRRRWYWKGRRSHQTIWKTIFSQKDSLVLKQNWLPFMKNAMHTWIVDIIKILISKGVSLPLQCVAYRVKTKKTWRRFWNRCFCGRRRRTDQ